MDNALFDQMRFVRSQTLKLVSGLTEEQADVVPEGFRNTIRWHLGHIYTVTERIVFSCVGLPLEHPPGFKELFENGTSPAAWDPSSAVPTLPELERLLAGQPDRAQAALAGRLNEEVAPYTTSAGMKLSTPGQFVSFGLYHEGMHFGILKTYKKRIVG